MGFQIEILHQKHIKTYHWQIMICYQDLQQTKEDLMVSLLKSKY